MRACASFLSFLVLLLVPFASGQSCEDSRTHCISDAISDEGAYVNCDMCVCENFDSAFNGGGNCATDSEDLYDCYMRFTLEDNTWSCQLRMKVAWIIGFVAISCFVCCLLCGGGCCLFKRCQDTPQKGSRETEVLMRNVN